MLALPTLPPLTRLPTELPSSPSDPRPPCCLWLSQSATFRPCRAGRQLNLTCHMTTSVRPHTHHSLSSVRCVERGLTSATPSCLLVGMDTIWYLLATHHSFSIHYISKLCSAVPLDSRGGLPPSLRIYVATAAAEL